MLFRIRSSCFTFSPYNFYHYFFNIGKYTGSRNFGYYGHNSNNSNTHQNINKKKLLDPSREEMEIKKREKELLEKLIRESKVNKNNDKKSFD